MEFIGSMAALFVTGNFIVTFNFQAFEIPSRSMENTLLIGDHLFVDRTTAAPQTNAVKWLVPYHDIKRGDIIVFISPVQPGLHVVKRIIGVPGDRIHLRDGQVFLNGVEQKEPYVYYDYDSINHAPDMYRDNFPAASPFGRATPEWAANMHKYIQGQDVVVPKDHYFAMGDNRDVSYDSRFWGFVPQENVMGGPLFIAWSLNQTEADFEPKSMPERIGAFIYTAMHFLGMTRWHRTLHLVH